MGASSWRRDAKLYVVSGSGDPDEQVARLSRAIDGGADIVQLRNKTADRGPLLRAAKALVAYAREHDALVVVNDHLDVAMAVGADGVHLGQDDLPIDVARRLWPEGLVGLSTHSLEQAQAAAAAGADYIGVGPVYATPTKPGRPAVGVELVREVAGEVEIPWFAIGGIDSESVGAVLDAGARRVAVVRAVAGAADPAKAAVALREAIINAAVPA